MLHPYEQLIADIAQDYGHEPRLVNAIAWQESNFKSSAYRFEPNFWRKYLVRDSRFANAIPERVAASYGLLQVMYTTALEHGYFGEPEFLFVPSVGLHYGCAHLAHLRDWAKGDISLMLAAYNGGQGSPNAVYAGQVMRKYEHLKTNGY
jgi:soluble lytic murein transglycosylase-like protein